MICISLYTILAFIIGLLGFKVAQNELNGDGHFWWYMFGAFSFVGGLIYLLVTALF